MPTVSKKSPDTSCADVNLVHKVRSSPVEATKRDSLMTMRLGVDFGTTRTTAAVVDRGNYPALTFPDADGDAQGYVPSIAAEVDGRLVYGHEAAAAARQGASHLRSFKRLLSSAGVTEATSTRVGSIELPLIDLVTEFLAHVAAAIRSELQLDDGDSLEAAVGIPAQAHSGQRLLTLEAFRRAGFDVVAMLNEPSAAGFEYTHRHALTVTSRRTKVLVYDMGGGTFDASLVAATGTNHDVLASMGDNELGGDDFDVALAKLAVERSGAPLPDDQWDALVDAAREAKEALHPQSRYITLEVGGAPLVISVKDFYQAVAPFVTTTMATVEALLYGEGEVEESLPRDLAGLYVVGGASELPVITRMLRERYGRRVHRSPMTAASTAVGLAIAADPEAGYTLTDRLSRGVGVYREEENGARVNFESLLTPELRTSLTEPVTVSRTYRAVHNVGRYRFAEYTLDANGLPRGTAIPLGEVLMPFDAALRGTDIDLENVPVQRIGNGPLIEELCTVDPTGVVTVTLRDVEAGFEVSQTLGKAD